MVSVEARARLLRKRAAALTLPESAMESAEAAVRRAGMRLPGAAEALRVEWFNDLLASDDAPLFSLAARNPAVHFLAWIAERSADPFHVSYRSVDAVTRRFGADVSSRLLVAWRQEVAWAQRMRRYPNPRVATKAALFLREAEGTPGKVFERLADAFGDAFATPDYVNHAAHVLSDREIRFSEHVPEFTPLFLRYAARAYSDRLASMSRDKFEALASRAAREEEEDRGRASARRSAEIARLSPMRRMLPVMSRAHSLGVAANDLHAIEEAFVASLAAGERTVPPGTGCPYPDFLMAIADPEIRRSLLAAGPPPADPDALAWAVVNLRPAWVSSLPDGFRQLGEHLRERMVDWQSEVAEERREPPADPVSDFGFYLLGSAQ